MSAIVLKIGKFVVTATAIVALLFVLSSYITLSGIPFVEGTWRTESGSAYGFEIGMAKDDAFVVLRSDYSLPDHYIEIIWPKGSEADRILTEFENTSDAKRTNRSYGIYRLAIVDLNELTQPMQTYGEWKLQLPASWVNSINLEFQGDSLKRITRDRWVFERP